MSELSLRHIARNWFIQRGVAHRRGASTSDAKACQHLVPRAAVSQVNLIQIRLWIFAFG
ncbi:hypothetical protein RQ479_00530 [Mesorhizobium sp. ISC25]|uniref:hypothetical protein n=1 Tax=Mesorhizobium sp. ISC25 TaxID=3077335 RepID=UPI0035D654DB